MIIRSKPRHLLSIVAYKILYLRKDPALVLICFVLPAVLTWLFGLLFRKLGWIREGDLKLD